ncbi:amidohydrolase family protein [Thermodesulfobacteriota bacterium]
MSLLSKPLPALNDAEGDKIPAALPPIIDAHIHIFPDGIFQSVRNWFDQYGWPIRYRLPSSEVLGYLLSRGITHVVAYQYAHKPGIADDLNHYMVEQCQKYPQQITGMATVFPGEKNCENILKKAFDAGLKGVKLHAHVQCFDMNSREMDIIYDLCALEAKPLVMHAGREPKSPAYKCDPHVLCSAEKLENVIKNYPGLKVSVPHLGFDEILPYARLIEKYDNLWLDTAMALTDYFPKKDPVSLRKMRTDRIMYGSDFPNIPYAWDRELKWIKEAGFPDDVLEFVLAKNAMDFFSLES